MEEKLKDLINQWKLEFGEVRSALIEIGAKGDSLEYNLLANEALRLSMCISDATDLLVDAKVQS